MPQAVDSLASLVEQLTERLRDLESRVSALERLSVTPSVKDRYSSANRLGKTHSTGAGNWTDFSAVFPTLGKAALGFAGAFLLRAIAESAWTPKLPVLSVAILYAFFWMLWAVQPDWLHGVLRFSKKGSSDRFTGVTYAVTSALILCPLLWESTIRFQVLSPASSSVVLFAFMAATLALSSGNNLQIIPWVAAISTAFTALALIIATRDLVPLTAAMLAFSLATEITIIFGHQLTFRAIPALVSDLGIWLLISVLTADPLPEGYHPAAVPTIVLLTVLLPAIYATSIAVRGFLQLRRITVFEIFQAALAFALATYGVVHVMQNSAPVLGAIFLLLAIVCYWGTLSRFAAESYNRNRRFSANAAAALMLAGCYLLLPMEWRLPFLCLAALFTTMMYTRTLKLSLGLHASVYIAAATAISSLPGYVASAMGGIIPTASQWPALTIALIAALCYAAGSQTHLDGARRRLLWVVPATVAASSFAALVVSAVVRFTASHAELAASYLSVVRTLVICGLALSLGLSAREPRIELGWIAYAAVAFGTLKLVLEDLRFGNPASLVLSFLFYGLVLILLPRVIRRTRIRERAGKHNSA